MVVPKDWDLPSEGNDVLSEKFEAHIHEGKEGRMPYRLFVPDPSEKVPKVLYIHGADCVGDDNISQLSMHDIGTMYARPSWQKKHPCYVLAPQYGIGMGYTVTDVGAAIQDLLEQVIREHDDIDRSRIYIYGYSAGGAKLYRLLKQHPGFYAGAIGICGSTDRAFLEDITKTPLYMVHAVDDPVVRYSYKSGNQDVRKLSHLGSGDIHEMFRETVDWDMHVKFPEKGFMKEHYHVNAHCSWVYVSDPGNRDISEWLFSKRLK